MKKIMALTAAIGLALGVSATSLAAEPGVLPGVTAEIAGYEMIDYAKVPTPIIERTYDENFKLNPTTVTEKYTVVVELTVLGDEVLPLRHLKAAPIGVIEASMTPLDFCAEEYVDNKIVYYSERNLVEPVELLDIIGYNPVIYSNKVIVNGYDFY